MADLELSLAITPYDRVQPLITGEVKPRGVSLRYTDIPLNEIWSRQLGRDEFDISEMSISFWLRARALGWGYQALPVFHNRNFSYTGTQVRQGSGIRVGHPEDLKGKRIAIADYQMSAVLWARGVLEHEFGVTPQEVEWFPTRPDPFIPGETEPFRPPPGVTVHPVSKDMASLFLQGEVDAAFMVGQVSGELARSQKLQPLFPDPRKESLRYYKKTGIFPPHHVTVVRESLLKEHPWLAGSLLGAFEQAKKLALQRLSQRPPSLLVFGGQTLKEQRSIFGDDPYPSGLQPNGASIDAVQTFSLEQGLTKRKQPWEELFAQGEL